MLAATITLTASEAVDAGGGADTTSNQFPWATLIVVVVVVCVLLAIQARRRRAM